MLKVFTLSQYENWDAAVKSFRDYDVYYLSGYVAPFAVHGDGEPLLFYYENTGIRAINVVMKRDISRDIKFAKLLPENAYFDFATPYGYGGWLVEGSSNKDKLFEEYNTWCLDNHIVSEFVRYNPILKNREYTDGFYETFKLGETVAMDLDSAEVIWANMTSKNRNMVRKAEKSGITINVGNDDELYGKFKLIYDATMDRDNADAYYYFEPEFYKTLQNDLIENARVFYAQLPDGNIIAASIIMNCNGKLHYHLSGSKVEYRSLAPTNMLLHKAALWGMENGCHVFHLGGGVGAQNDCLFKFKRSFYKGETKEYYIGKKIFDREIYNRLVKMRGEILEQSNYFPQYRG